MSSLSVWEWNRDFPGNNLRHKLQDKLMAKLQLIFKANVMIIQTSENLHSENRPLIRLLSSVDLSDIISMIWSPFLTPRVSSSLWQCHDATLTRVIWQVVTRCDKFWQILTSYDKLWQDAAFNDLSRIVTRKSQVNAGSCCSLWVSRSNKVDVELVFHVTCSFDHVPY